MGQSSPTHKRERNKDKGGEIEKEAPNPPEKHFTWPNIWNALRKHWMLVLGSLLIAVSWSLQNFFVEKYKDKIQEIRINLADYWRQENDARQMDWYYMFTSMHNIKVPPEQMLSTDWTFDSTKYRERLRMADVQELIDHHAMRLSSFKLLYEGDTVDQEADTTFENDNFTDTLWTHKMDTHLESLLEKDNNASDHFQKWFKPGVAKKIDDLNNSISLWRFVFYACFIIGTIFITANRVKEYMTNSGMEK